MILSRNNPLSCPQKKATLAICLLFFNLLGLAPCFAQGLLAPIITAQPQSQSVQLSGSVTFSVSAASLTTLTFQWLKNGSAISGATSSSYTISSVKTNDAAGYSAQVSNSGGTVTSSTATLTVLVPPAIATQPQNAAVIAGQSATFSVSAIGTSPLRYLWRFGSTNVSSGTNATLSLTNVQSSQAGNYSVVITNSLGSVTSAVATLTVYVAPTITWQPQSQTAIQGQNMLLSVAASGTAPFGYQWQATNSASGGFTNLTNGGQTSGASTNILQIANVTASNALFYRVIITNIAGSVTSAPASLTVYPNVVLIDGDFGSGTTQTGAAILGSPGDVWNAITAASSTPVSSAGTALSGIGITLANASQIYYAASGTPADPGTTNLMQDYAFGYTNSSYTPTITTGFTGLTPYTNSAFVLVLYAAGNMSGQGGSLTLKGAAGGNAASTLTCNAASRQISAGAGVAYNVFYGILTNGTLTVTSTELPGQAFTCMNGFQLELSPLPMIIAQPASQTNANGNTASFTVSAFGAGALSYQWQAGPAGGPYTNLNDGGQITGSASNVLTISSLTANWSGGYQVIVSNNGGSVTSAPAILTLPPQILTQPASQTAIAGGNASLSVVANGSAPLSYQWNFQGVNVPGATNAWLTLANAQPTNAGNYSVVIANNVGSVTSSVATLTVLVPPAITTPPQDQTLVLGQATSFAVVASGSAPLAYQWYFNGANILAATNSLLALTNVQTTSAGNYSVVVTNVAGAATSSVATLTVLVPPTISIPPQSQTVTQGLNAAFSVAASGTAPLAYQWYFNGANIPAATNSLLALTNVQIASASNYSVVVTNVAGAATSSVATLTVLVPPDIVAQPQSQAVIKGQSVSFTVFASGTGPLAYQWYFNDTNIVGATNYSLSLTNVKWADHGKYAAVITNLAGATTSAVVNLTVYIPPDITAPPQSQTLSLGQSAAFAVTAQGTSPLNYQWYFNTAALAGATNALLALASAHAADAGSYTVVITNIAGSIASTPAILTLTNPAIKLAMTSAPGIFSNGCNFQISLPVGSTYVVLSSTNFQDWTPVVTNVAATGNESFTDASATNLPAQFYRVMVW